MASIRNLLFCRPFRDSFWFRLATRGFRPGLYSLAPSGLLPFRLGLPFCLGLSFCLGLPLCLGLPFCLGLPCSASAPQLAVTIPAAGNLPVRQRPTAND